MGEEEGLFSSASSDLLFSCCLPACWLAELETKGCFDLVRNFVRNFEGVRGGGGRRG